MTNIFRIKAIFIATALLLLFVPSCQKEDETRHTSLSPEAKKIFDHLLLVSRKNPNGDQTLTDFLAAFATLKNPTVKDVLEKHRVMANYYVQYKPNSAKANLYADSMLYTLKNKEHIYTEEYVAALFYKGDAEALIKNYDQAFKYYYDAREFSLKHFDKCAYFTTSMQLGSIRYNQERYAEAIPFFRQAVDQSYGCKYDGRFAQRQGIVNTLALCFEKANQLDSAIFYYKQALSVIDDETRNGLFNAQTSQAAKGVVYGNMGGTYAKLNQFKEAEKYLKQSIAINDRPGYEPIDAQTAKLKLAVLYLKHKRFDAAHVLLEELQQASTDKKPRKKMPISSQLKLYDLAWQYFEKTNNKAKAHLYLQRYYAIRDSIEEAEAKLKATDLDLIFKAHTQHDKLELLAKDNEIKRNYIIAFIVFTILVIAVLLLLWFNYRKLKALNNEITGQNMVMQKVLGALEHSQEENTRMMKIVAHDLRSPIAATLSIAEILKMADLSEADREIVSLLETTNHQSLDMIGNLLNMNAKPDELIIEPVKMRQFLKHCINLFKFKASEKQQKIKLNAKEIEIRADGNKIWRVFSNLISNAIKFSPAGTTISIALQQKNKSIVVSVCDEGIGIPEEIRNGIFNIYTDAKRKGTSGEHSFGLGLAISKQIVEAHHGKIWLESEVGKGSTFFVELIKD